MGPLSVALRAPFAALSDALGHDVLTEYRVGAAVCLVPAAALALVVARRAVALTGALHVGLLLVALLVVNPLVFNALQAGHPEEMLAGALGVAAVLLASADRPVWAVLALAAAVATKQSALVALGPVLFALDPPARRRATLVGAAGVAVLVAPYALGGPGAFWEMNERLLRGSTDTLPFTVWWPLASGPGEVRLIGEAAAPIGRVLTLLVPLVAAWLLARRAAGRLDVQAAMALLAVGCLLRCLLDPADNPYYHVPAVYALAVWETERRRGAPWLAIVTSALMWWLIVGPWRAGDPSVVATLYLLWMVPLTAGLAVWLVRRRA